MENYSEIRSVGKDMKELNSLKKGPSALLIKHPLKVVARTDVVEGPTRRQMEATKRFFDNCNVSLSRIVSEPEKIDGLSTLPEVAFMGRSNVGKSSLLNALLYPKSSSGSVTNKEFARVANNPGYTKTLNFFTCGRQVRVVDMPGYGHGSRTQQGELIKSYLQNQRSLKRAYVLASCKEGLTQLDDMVMDMLEEYGIPWQLVYTKLDKLVTKPIDVTAPASAPKNQKQSLLQKLSKKPPTPQQKIPTQQLSLEDTETINRRVQQGLELVQQRANAAVFEEVIGTSSTKMLSYLGIDELRASIFQACGLLRK